MTPRRSISTAFVLFVAAVVAWLVVRSHVAPHAGDVSERPSVNRPSSPSAPRPLPSPTGAAAAATSPVPTTQISPVAVGSTLGPAGTPTNQILLAPPLSDPAAARSDAASINAIKVRRMVTDFHTLTGENPTGTNAEIMAELMGKNSHQAILGPPEGLVLNGKGELIDDWGTPYFFHQLSRDVMEIHSAGPDKIMGTADDVVVR